MFFFGTPFFIVSPIFTIIIIIFSFKIIRKIINSISRRIDSDQEERHYIGGFRHFDGFRGSDLQEFDGRLLSQGELTKKEVAIFRLADKMKGRITVSDIVLETSMGIKEAEEFANALVDGTHVRMEVTDNGSVVYEFPEIIEKYRR